jgi:hypothetical protein
MVEDLDSQLSALCYRIFVVVADPCLHVRLIVLLPAEWGEVEVVVGADEQVETTLVGRVGVKDAVVSTKEDAQTRELPFENEISSASRSVPASS